MPLSRRRLLPRRIANTSLSFVGLSLLDAMRALAPHEEAHQHDRLVDAYKHAFQEFRAANRHPEDLFDGAHDLLVKLRARD